MTTPLFLLRCLEIGLSMKDLEDLTIGMVMDIWTEKGNDSATYDNLATQEDFDKFQQLERENDSSEFII